MRETQLYLVDLFTDSLLNEILFKLVLFQKLTIIKDAGGVQVDLPHFLLQGVDSLLDRGEFKGLVLEHPFLAHRFRSAVDFGGLRIALIFEFPDLIMDLLYLLLRLLINFVVKRGYIKHDRGGYIFHEMVNRGQFGVRLVIIVRIDSRFEFILKIGMLK